MWFSGSWRILANDLREKLLLCLLTSCSVSCPSCTAGRFPYGSVRPSSPAGWLFNIINCGNQKCRLLILTVLAQSAHEPWRTVTWPVVFVTHAAILTNRAGICAAGSPQSLGTHCKRDSHFHQLHHVKCVRLFILKTRSALTVLTALSWRARWTLAPSRHVVTCGAAAVTRTDAAGSKASRWTVWHGTHRRAWSQHERTTPWWWKARSLCLGHLPWSQFSPWRPGGHFRWHSPVTWSHDTPGGQEHFFSQVAP